MTAYLIDQDEAARCVLEALRNTHAEILRERDNPPPPGVDYREHYRDRSCRAAGVERCFEPVGAAIMACAATITDTTRTGGQG